MFAAPKPTPPTLPPSGFIDLDTWLITGDWRTVVSSHVLRIKYIIDRQELFVQFRDGSIYRYDRVPETTACRFFAAPSFGKFVHSDIKGRYPFTKINR